MSTTMFGKLGIVTLTALLLTYGCRFSEVNTGHCAYNDGDAYCAAQYPDGSRPYCESGEDSCVSPDTLYGCVAERPADECYSPCGGRSTIDEDGECLMEESSSGSSSGGTETEESSGSSESSTTGPVPCVGNEDCPDAAAPLCEPGSGECVACDAFGADGDVACAGLDPGMPLCVDGACVQCTAEAPEACTGETPVCDDAKNTCVPCTEHAQCGEAACNLFTGACLPADAVVHVGVGQAYTTITAAVASFDMMTEGTIIVHAGSYNEAVTANGGRALAFLVNAGDLPEWDTPAGNPATPQLMVTDATVLMDGLQLSGNGSAAAPALRVDGGRAWVDRSRIVQNSGGGIVAQSAAELVVRSCFVGGDVSDISAFTVNGSTATILSVTTGAGFGAAAALVCDAAATVDVRNSLFVARTDGDEVMCNATVEQSAAELDLGGTNTALGPMNTAWFTGYATGDFHLATPPITVANAAQWQTGDPTTDIDGDLRPTVDGTADFAGADVP